MSELNWRLTFVQKVKQRFMASMKFLLLLPKHGLVGYLLFFNDTVVKKIISIGLLSFGTGIVIAKDIDEDCSRLAGLTNIAP